MHQHLQRKADNWRRAERKLVLVSLHIGMRSDTYLKRYLQKSNDGGD